MNVKDLEKICLRVVALVGLNAVALFFDGQWIYAAAAVDCLVLGVSIKDVLP